MCNYIGLVVMFALGLFMLLKPEWLWKLEHLFSVKSGEPSELYLAKMRLGGAFLLLTSIILPILLFVKIA